ncbi:uncharacterized protein MELLADRAFT_106507 [Melampsora larici-populina 98AG31]|uniref:Secreted protein n=1 Tax=Melampsora larici-populina (strain 98AG31 / pathotype 3-4-7) TaxID=747676 RepID=F4RLQ7_MELLP|nr:uncharacterized protein MELLADRAFT_106507 [Melampsora larici-populina 98AG31]EGG06579.1 secreted protein [Melampsora larici-populina 98AG31]
MFQTLLKISLLLLCLWIYESKVLASNDPLEGNPTCNQKFSINPDGSAVCIEAVPGQIAYKCQLSSCWRNNHQFVPLSGCQLKNSSNKGISNQQCAQYEYLETVVSCTNSGGVTYLCPYTPYMAYLECTSCTKQ